MGNWVIRYATPASPWKLERKRRMAISTGDRVIGIERADDDVLFLWHGRVAEAKVTDIAPDSGPMFKGTFSFDSVEQFTEARSLTSFADSLLRVYSYDAPERHFRTAYVSMADQDFETLVEGEIFIARAAVGAFLRDLPTATVRRFVQHVGVSLPGAIAGHANMHDVWTTLAHFIRGELVDPAQLIHASLTRARDLNERQGHDRAGHDSPRGTGAIPVAELAVETDSGPGNLAQQDARMQAFLDLAIRGNGPDLFARVEQAIQADAHSQGEFERRFQGAPWPLPRTRF